MFSDFNLLKDFEGFICEVHDNVDVQSQSGESFQGMNGYIFDNCEHDLKVFETKNEWVLNTKRYQHYYKMSPSSLQVSLDFE